MENLAQSHHCVIAFRSTFSSAPAAAADRQTDRQTDTFLTGVSSSGPSPPPNFCTQNKQKSHTRLRISSHWPSSAPRSRPLDYRAATEGGREGGSHRACARAPCVRTRAVCLHVKKAVAGRVEGAALVRTGRCEHLLSECLDSYGHWLATRQEVWYSRAVGWTVGIWLLAGEKERKKERCVAPEIHTGCNNFFSRPPPPPSRINSFRPAHTYSVSV